MPTFSRELFSFIEVAREQSIRKAAEKLNIASSALSRQIRLLESDLGVQLLTRSVKGVQLTEHGRIVLGQAEKWIEDGNRLREKLSNVGAGEENKIRIGAMECFEKTLMPNLFTTLKSRQPFNRMEAKFSDTKILLNDLENKALDMVIAFNAPQSQSVKVLASLSCRVGLVYSQNQFNIKEKEISILNCLDWPICLPGEELSLYPRLFSEILKQRKNPDIIAISNSIEFIRELVLQEHGVSFLTWFDVYDDVLAGRLGYIPLTEKRLTEKLCICVNGNDPLCPTVKAIASTTEQLIIGMYENMP